MPSETLPARTSPQTTTAPEAAPRRARGGHPAYRPDIDGLRAIAVTSVVLFHAKVSDFSGGFVGVDIFFVISGYLITLVIRQQVEAGTFTFANFYERRVRRIAPAFLAAVAFTVVLCFLFQMPADLHKFTGSLVATVLSVSNFYFWINSGYFDLPSSQQPLLQTWSLAVEEQFYVVLPITLVLCARYFPKAVRPALAIVGLLSFAISAWSVEIYPETTFYMLHTRAWELLMGSVIAYGMVPSFTSVLWRNVATSVGLVLIVYAILMYSPFTPFPGPTALVPCLGAALIIAAGRSGPSLVSRGLGLRPIVFIGLISYSVYLWHWPIVVFQYSDALLIDGSSKVGKVAIIVASYSIGTLSWWLIERPFRRPSFMTRRQIFSATGVGAVVMIGIAGALAVAPPRFPPEVAAMAAHLADQPFHMRDGKCFISNRYSFSDYDKQACMVWSADKPNYLLIGDSHAAHLWYGLSQAALPGINLMQTTAAGCKPILADRGGPRPCNRIMSFLFDDYLPSHKVDRLLIAADWAAGDLPGLAKTLEWADSNHIPTVLFGLIEVYSEALPHLLAVALYHHQPDLPQSHLMSDGGLDAKMAALAAQYHVDYISMQKLLCPQGRCITMADQSTPLQFDASHLTQPGSLLVGELIAKQHLLP